MNWADATIFVFDTETTGLDFEKDEIIQLTLIRYDVGKRWCDMTGFTQKFSTTRPLPAGRALYCGITPEELEGQPTISDCMDTILDLFKPGMVFCAFNAPFDGIMLRNALARTGSRRKLPMTRRNTLDPLPFSRGLYPSVRGHKLGQVAARLGVRLDRAHDATSDSLAAAEVLMRLAAQHNLPQDLDGMITLQQQYAEKWSSLTGYPVEVW